MSTSTNNITNNNRSCEEEPQKWKRYEERDTHMIGDDYDENNNDDHAGDGDDDVVDEMNERDEYPGGGTGSEEGLGGGGGGGGGPGGWEGDQRVDETISRALVSSSSSSLRVLIGRAQKSFDNGAHEEAVRIIGEAEAIWSDQFRHLINNNDDHNDDESKEQTVGAAAAAPTGMGSTSRQIRQVLLIMGVNMRYTQSIVFSSLGETQRAYFHAHDALKLDRMVGDLGGQRNIAITLLLAKLCMILEFYDEADQLYTAARKGFPPEKWPLVQRGIRALQAQFLRRYLLFSCSEKSGGDDDNDDDDDDAVGKYVNPEVRPTIGSLMEYIGERNMEEFLLEKSTASQSSPQILPSEKECNSRATSGPLMTMNNL